MSMTYLARSEAIPAYGGAVVDCALRLIELDDAFAELVGDTVASLLGRKIGEVLPALEAPVRAALADERPYGPLTITDSQGAPVTCRLTPLRTARGTLFGAELTIAPATAPARPAAVGSLQSPSVRAVLDGLFAFAGVLLPDGTLIEANRAALEAAGLAPEDVVGRPFEEAFWWSYDQAVQARLRAAIACAAQGESVRYDVPVRLAGGRFITIDFMLAPARDASGEVQYLIPSGIDISEREELLRREQAARAAAERTTARLIQLQATTAALSEALMPAQMAEVIVRQALAALGADAGALWLLSADRRTLDVCCSAGVPAEALARWAQVPLAFPAPASAATRSGRPLFFADQASLAAAYPQIAPLVAELGYEALAVVPLSVEGQPLGALALAFSAPQCLVEDDRNLLLAMTGQAAQAIARARLYNDVREALDTRDSFIAIASHDLRSPLTALLGQADLLERRLLTSAPEQLARRVRLIIEQAQRLNRMVDALLDISRIQSGQLEISVAPLDLTDLVARVVAVIQPTLSQHRLELVGAPTALRVAGDEVRLEQVLYNLIGNAVKYSPEGGAITVEVVREAAQARLTVCDEGIGIPAEALPRLFERYYRAANASTSGMGIGLYAAREILALHGGTITVVSTEGQGSSFTISLPCLAEDDRADGAG
jgi:PAS domain S-box-containing protein